MPGPRDGLPAALPNARERGLSQPESRPHGRRVAYPASEEEAESGMSAGPQGGGPQASSPREGPSGALAQGLRGPRAIPDLLIVYLPWTAPASRPPTRRRRGVRRAPRAAARVPGDVLAADAAAGGRAACVQLAATRLLRLRRLGLQLRHVG